MFDLRSLWNFSDPAVSEAKFDEFLTGELSSDLRAEALTQKARAQGLQRRFDDARATLAGAKELLGDEPTSGHAAYWLELGRVENSSGKPEFALPCFLRALELGEAGHHENLSVDAAHMLAIVEKGEASLKWNERAIEMAEAATEPRARNWLGSLLNNTGWTRYGMGQYDQALVLFEKALEFRKEQGNEENTRVARYCVAKCLRSLGRVEESLSQQYELEKEVLAVQNEAGFNWEEIGECLLLLQREEESKTYFAKAYRALAKDEWIVADEPERLERLKGLAGSSLMP